MLNVIGRIQNIRDLLTKSDLRIQLIVIDPTQHFRVSDRQLMARLMRKQIRNGIQGKMNNITDLLLKIL